LPAKEVIIMSHIAHRSILALGVAGLVLAAVPGAVSARNTTTPVRQQTGPSFVFPSDGTVLPYNGTLTFQVQPVSGANGYLWSFVQNGGIAWQNLDSDGSLSPNTYTMKPGSRAHNSVRPGALQVRVRAQLGGNRWTAASVITIQLRGAGGSGPKPQPTTAPSKPAPGTTLFYADTSGGLDKLGGGSSWKHVNGMLVNDGSAYPNALLRLPVKPATANYAVEASIQLVGGSDEFGVVARLDSNNKGLSGSLEGGQGAVLISGDPTNYFDGFKQQSGYNADSAYHTYRLEVNGNNVTFLVDGSAVLQGVDNRFLDPGQPGLWDAQRTQINVKSIRVIAL